MYSAIKRRRKVIFECSKMADKDTLWTEEKLTRLIEKNNNKST